MIERPPRVPAEASPLEREVAAEVRVGGLADAAITAEPEVIDVIVMT